jgi:hypothetical protein
MEVYKKKGTLKIGFADEYKIGKSKNDLLADV